MFTSNRSSGSICDRLKQRYANYQQDWQSLFKIQENNTGDFEFIQYIVNFIIEQAKHNIVISELPDVIRVLHCEAEDILRKNRMITLEEIIAQVQIVGAMKYPYLKKIKPISTEDFVKEVMREVFDRLGTIITLDMIEDICRFTACSAKQLLNAMPAIDVSEAATLIVEDILRNQREINKNQKKADILKETRSVSSLSTKTMNRKLEGTPVSISKERIRSQHELSRSTQNSKQSFSKTKLIEPKDSPMSSSISQRSSKNINKNQIGATENRLLKLKKSNSHCTQTIMENPFVTIPRRISKKKPRSMNVLSSTFVPFDTCSTKECLQIETSVQKRTENQKEKIRNPLTANLFPILNNNLIVQEKNQKINVFRSKSNTQTYSIHSEEGLSAQTQRPTATSVSNMNDSAILSTFIQPTRSPNKISKKSVKQISSHTASFTNIAPFSNELVYSKDRPFISEAMHNSDLKETRSSHSQMLHAIRHYTKDCYRHTDISDNEEQITETDTEKCPLEDILNHRFIQ